MFETNVGGIDRIIRIVVSLAFVGAFFFMPTFGYRWVFLALAAISLITALMRICPLYSIFGFSSCRLKNN